MQAHNQILKDEEKIALRELMEKARVPGVSIAKVEIRNNDQMSNLLSITTDELGVTNDTASIAITPDTRFGAASLSKPVFTYLIMKLDEVGILGLNEELWKILPFEKFCQVKSFPFIKTKENLERLRALNAKMVLSHTSGLELHRDQPIDFMFEPGSEYLYSGLPMYYLQSVIEKRTGKTLEELAQQFVFRPLLMEKTTFQPTSDVNSACSANSLFTTAGDFAKLIAAWLLDPKLRKAFEPNLHLYQNGKTYDKWANPEKVSPKDQAYLATGLGWDLELNEQGKAIRAYKTGDMGNWRAQAVINLENDSAIMFFANAQNGHMLADQIIQSKIGLKHGLNYFFDKFGFLREHEFLNEADKACDVMLMASEPNIDTLKSISSHQLYVIYGNQLYYLNKTHNLCLEIEINRDPHIHNTNIHILSGKIKPTDEPKTLSNNDLKIIKNITGCAPWQHLEQAKMAEINRHVESRIGITGISISDEQMAKSAFGISSHTAKAHLKISTTSKLKEVFTKVPASKATHNVDHTKEKNVSQQSISSKQDFETNDPEKSNKAYKSPTLKPSGFK